MEPLNSHRRVNSIVVARRFLGSRTFFAWGFSSSAGKRVLVGSCTELYGLVVGKKPLRDPVVSVIRNSAGWLSYGKCRRPILHLVICPWHNSGYFRGGRIHGWRCRIEWGGVLQDQYVGGQRGGEKGEMAPEGRSIPGRNYGSKNSATKNLNYRREGVLQDYRGMIFG